MRNENIESSLDCLVLALCKDYERRSSKIASGASQRRTLVEFRYLNFKIFDAAAEIAGEELAPLYIKEIGEGIGYAKSALDGISEGTYKKYKKLIKENIAKKLHLSD